MTQRSFDQQHWLPAQLSRRKLVASAGATALTLTADRHAAYAQAKGGPTADHTIRIEPISLEIAPGKVIKTTAYNGTVPGPLLRLREGKPVAINVINQSGYPNLIHWHGLFTPSRQDGSAEEGSPIIAPRPLVALRLHAKAGRHALVPQSCHGHDRSHQEHLFRRVRLSGGGAVRRRAWPV